MTRLKYYEHSVLWLFIQNATPLWVCTFHRCILNLSVKVHSMWTKWISEWVLPSRCPGHSIVPLYPITGAGVLKARMSSWHHLNEKSLKVFSEVSQLQDITEQTPAKHQGPFCPWPFWWRLSSNTTFSCCLFNKTNFILSEGHCPLSCCLWGMFPGSS